MGGCTNGTVSLLLRADGVPVQECRVAAEGHALRCLRLRAPWSGHLSVRPAWFRSPFAACACHSLLLSGRGNAEASAAEAPTSRSFQPPPPSASSSSSLPLRRTGS